MSDKYSSRKEVTTEFEQRTVSDAVIAEPLEVRVHENNFDRASKAFRAMVQKEKILTLVKEKSVFEKRSDRRRRKIKEAKRKLYEAQFKSRSHPRREKKEKYEDYEDK